MVVKAQEQVSHGIAQEQVSQDTAQEQVSADSELAGTHAFELLGANVTYGELAVGLVISLVAAAFYSRIQSFFKWIKKYFSIVLPIKRNIHFTRNIEKCQFEQVSPGVTLLERYNYIATFPASMVFGASKKNSPRSIRSAKNRSSNKKRDAYYKTHIMPYTLRVSDGNDGSEIRELTARRIVDKYVYPLFIQKRSPSTIVINGKVGVGKTTLSVQIASIVQNDNDLGNGDPDTLVVYIDIRKLLNDYFRVNEVFNMEVEVINIDRDVQKIIDDEVIRLIRLALIPGINDDDSLNSVIDKVYEQYVRLLIIIDEVDFLYTDFSRRISSSRGYPGQRFMAMYNCIFRMILNYSDSCSASNKLNLNTVVITSARSNSLKLFSEVGSRVDLSNTNIISIVTHNNSRAKDIFVTKIQANIENSSTPDDEREHLKSLKGDILNVAQCYEKNLAVSVHGLRHLINLMVKLSNQDKSGRLLREIFSKPGLLRLYQYLDGCSNYSQAYEGISNIFLVNSDAERAKRNKIDPATTAHLDMHLLEDHLHSYWLKYLLLLYITHTCKNHNESISFDDVIQVFSFSDGDQNTVYENNTVRLILMNASKVDHGRLIKFKAAGEIQIMPTTRLLYLLNNQLFWEFGYLMIVIEDEWLELPKVFNKKLKVDLQKKSAFNFVTNFHLLTHDKKKEFVLYKAEMVMVFYDLLEVALRYESRRYKKVFDTLESAGINFDKILPPRETIVVSIVGFAKKYASESTRDEVEKYLADDFEQSSVRKNEFTEFYNKHYDLRLMLKDKPRIEKSMDMYYSL